MKIKGFIIPGVILLGAGIAIAGIAATKIDFNSNAEMVFNDLYFNAGDVKTIKIDSAADQVKLVSTDRSDIYVRTKELKTRKYDVEVKNEELVIAAGNFNWWNSLVSFPWLDQKKFSSEPLIIEVPADSFFNLDVEVGAGTLLLNGIKGDTVKAELSAGEIKVENAEVTNLTGSVNAGRFTATNLTASNLTWTVNAGYAKFDNAKVNVVDLTVNSGEIVYNGVVRDKGEAQTNAGSITFNFTDSKDNYCVNGRGNGSVKINTQSNAGSVNVNYN